MSLSRFLSLLTSCCGLRRQPRNDKRLLIVDIKTGGKRRLKGKGLTKSQDLADLYIQMSGIECRGASSDEPHASHVGLVRASIDNGSWCDLEQDAAQRDVVQLTRAELVSGLYADRTDTPRDASEGDEPPRIVGTLPSYNQVIFNSLRT